MTTKCARCYHYHYDENQDCTLNTCKCDHESFIAEPADSDRRYVKSILAKLDSTYERVLYLLQDEPNSRELNDKDFIWYYWGAYSGIKVGQILKPEMIEYATSPLTINRARYKVWVAHPELSPSAHTKRKRHLVQTAMSQWLRIESPGSRRQHQGNRTVQSKGI